MKELNGQKLQCSVRWARGAASTAPKTRTQPEVSDTFSGLRLPICEKFLCQGPDDADGAQVDEGRDDACGWCSGCLRCSRASGAVQLRAPPKLHIHSLFRVYTLVWSGLFSPRIQVPLPCDEILSTAMFPSWLL